MEADGLTQMLADEHSLDGDLLMSLPNQAAWQTWPAGTTTTPVELIILLLIYIFGSGFLVSAFFLLSDWMYRYFCCRK